MHLPSDQQNPENSRAVPPLQVPGSEPRPVKLPWVLRIAYFSLGLGLLGLLVVSRTLSPDPSGIGTHKQLGLPPCGYKIVFGVPCPSCGMTTSWALATRGKFISSARSNLGGFLLALMAFPAAIWLLVAGYQGRWAYWQPRPIVLSGLCALVIAAALIQWAIRYQFL